MNLEGFCKEYQLGNVKEVEKITGGLLHKMWKVQTEQGLYAIKILNPEIMTREDAYNNFTKSEEISSLAQENGIQVSNAIRLKENYLNKFEELYYMVFPYIDGKPLSDEEITIEHCRKIAQVLAKIHALDTSKVKLEKKIEKYQRLYPWDQYIENKNFIKMPYKDLYLENYKKYNSILKRANERFNESNKIQTLCHRDMDQKNVLWDGETPIIIDWESAGLMNPYRELVEVALSWSGFLSNSFDEKKIQNHNRRIYKI